MIKLFEKAPNANFSQPPRFPFVFNTPRIINNSSMVVQPNIIQMNYDEQFIPIIHSIIVPNVVPNRYMISNYGRVWDCFLNKMVPVQDNGHGYVKMKLAHYITWDIVEPLDVYMHRLVAFYFLYQPYCERLEVNHINGIKSDNRVCNLEWVNSQQNVEHAVRTGLIRRGEDKVNALLRNEEVETICKMIIAGKTNREIADIFNVPIDVIINIRNEKNYTSISNKYNLSRYTVNSHSKLSDTEVKLICEMLLNDNYSLDEICETVGCSKQQIKDIRYNNAYSHITKLYRMDLIRNRNIADKKSEKEVHKICSLLEKGLSAPEISKMRGIHKSQTEINNIKCGQAYKHISSLYNIPATKKTSNTIEQIHEVCKILEREGYNRNAQSIADEVGVSIDTVKHLRNKSIYKDIVSQYNIPDGKSIEKPLDKHTVKEICLMIQRYPTMQIRKISQLLNVPEFKVARIKNRQSYTEVSKDYIW